jgi:hypothetical protein
MVKTSAKSAIGERKGGFLKFLIRLRSTVLYTVKRPLKACLGIIV